MPPAATWIFLAIVSSAEAFAQLTFHLPSAETPASPGWPSGPPHSRVSFEGLLARSDGETLSVELPDQRVIRFGLGDQTRFRPDGPSDKLSAFHVADLVSVDAEVDSKGYLLARAVRFVRKASPAEQGEILQSPEMMQRWRDNILSGNSIDPAGDDRKLGLVAKPHPITDRAEDTTPSLRRAEFIQPGSKRETDPLRDGVGEDEVISLVRRTVNEAFERLPNLRAKQVTSLFHSTSKPIKWIPDSVVAAEVAYEEERESYSDIHIDGKRPVNAPETGSSEYMRSLDKAWSTGDFETISHCVFSELEDSDFHKVRTEHRDDGDLLTYEFTGQRSSGCVGLKFKSQIAYPAYKGSLKVRAQTREVLHVELQATEIPKAFPLDVAERSVDLGHVRIGGEQYLLPTTGYWFGCFRGSYSCFMNRMDFRDYRRFEADSIVRFDK